MFKKLSFQKQRGIAVLIAAFAVVLIGGVALAQIGSMGAGSGESGEPAPLAVDAPSESAETSPTMAAASVAGTATEATTFPSEPPPSDEPKPPGDKVKPPVDDEEPPDDDSTPPKLVILRPDDGAHTTDETITVKGETEPGAVVTYGSYEADMDDAGYWAMRVKLDMGRNVLVFHATDEAGNKSEATVTVVRDEPKPKPEPDHKFTAHQKWEAVDGEPVVNKYYGTAKPDTKIYVASEYGRAETKADKNGEWYVAVTFKGTECNTSWKVVVEASSGHRAEFRMKRVCKTDTKFTAHQKWEAVDGEPVVNKYYGTAKPDTKIYVASEYGRAETKADKNGEWYVAVTFKGTECNTSWKVVVEASSGHRAEFRMKRVCKTDTKFTAHQKFGSCSEAVPYDVFSGTGAPGLEVMVHSEHGSGSTVIGEGGKWRITVEFPNAPFDKEFPVKVKSSAGDRVDFWFVRTGGEK